MRSGKSENKEAGSLMNRVTVRSKKIATRHPSPPTDACLSARAAATHAALAPVSGDRIAVGCPMSVEMHEPQ